MSVQDFVLALVFSGFTLSDTVQQPRAVAGLCARPGKCLCERVLPAVLGCGRAGRWGLRGGPWAMLCSLRRAFLIVTGVPVRRGHGTQTQREEPVRVQGEGQKRNCRPSRPSRPRGPWPWPLCSSWSVGVLVPQQANSSHGRPLRP